MKTPFKTVEEAVAWTQDNPIPVHGMYEIDELVEAMEKRWSSDELNDEEFFNNEENVDAIKEIMEEIGLDEDDFETTIRYIQIIKNAWFILGGADSELIAKCLNACNGQVELDASTIDHEGYAWMCAKGMSIDTSY